MLIVLGLTPVKVVDGIVLILVLILVPVLFPEVFLGTFVLIRHHVLLHFVKPAAVLLVVGLVVVLVDLVEMYPF